MNSFRHLFALLIILTLRGSGAQIASSQENLSTSSTVQVHMVITDEALRDDTELPILRPENVQVNQGKTSLKVDHLIPARAARYNRSRRCLYVQRQHPDCAKLHSRSCRGGQGDPTAERQSVRHGQSVLIAH